MYSKLIFRNLQKKLQDLNKPGIFTIKQFCSLIDIAENNIFTLPFYRIKREQIVFEDFEAYIFNDFIKTFVKRAYKWYLPTRHLAWF